jgi:hypothetical protein
MRYPFTKPSRRSTTTISVLRSVRARYFAEYGLVQAHIFFPGGPIPLLLVESSEAQLQSVLLVCPKIPQNQSRNAVFRLFAKLYAKIVSSLSPE